MWQEQRRFTLRHLRDLGFGKTSIENQMMDEVDDLIREIATTAQSDPVGVVDFKGIFNVSVVPCLSSGQHSVGHCRREAISTRRP